MGASEVRKSVKRIIQGVHKNPSKDNIEDGFRRIYAMMDDDLWEENDGEEDEDEDEDEDEESEEGESFLEAVFSIFDDED